MAQIQGYATFLHAVGSNSGRHIGFQCERFHRTGNINSDSRRLYAQALGISQSMCREAVARLFIHFRKLVYIFSTRLHVSSQDI